MKAPEIRTNISRLFRGLAAVFCLLLVFSAPAFARCPQATIDNFCGRSDRFPESVFTAGTVRDNGPFRQLHDRGRLDRVTYASVGVVSGGAWNEHCPTARTHCMCNFYFKFTESQDPTKIGYMRQTWCDLRDDFTSTNTFANFNSCRTGFHVHQARGNNWYGPAVNGVDLCIPCTNAPDNAHYTSHGRDFRDNGQHPNSGPNQCPWRCNQGFGMNPARNGCIPCPGERGRSGASNGVCVTCAVGQIFDDSVGVERCVPARAVSQAMMMSGPRGAGIPIEEQCFSVLSDKGYECCINGNTWNNNAGKCCARGSSDYTDCIAKALPPAGG